MERYPLKTGRTTTIRRTAVPRDCSVSWQSLRAPLKPREHHVIHGMNRFKGAPQLGAHYAERLDYLRQRMCFFFSLTTHAEKEFSD